MGTVITGSICQVCRRSRVQPLWPLLATGDTFACYSCIQKSKTFETDSSKKGKFADELRAAPADPSLPEVDQVSSGYRNFKLQAPTPEPKSMNPNTETKLIITAVFFAILFIMTSPMIIKFFSP